MGRVERAESHGVLRMPGKMYTFEHAVTREGRRYVMIRGSRRRAPAPQLVVPVGHLTALIRRLQQIEGAISDKRSAIGGAE